MGRPDRGMGCWRVGGRGVGLWVGRTGGNGEDKEKGTWGHFALVRYAHLNLADHGSLTFNDYMTLSDQERKVVPAKLEC